METQIPDYINCKNKEIEACKWYMHKDCKETCAYALSIKKLNIGAISMTDLTRLLQDSKKTRLRTSRQI